MNYAVRFEQAFASGDWSVVASCFRPDAVLEIGGDGEIARYEERFADGTWVRVAAWLTAHGAKLAPVEGA